MPIADIRTRAEQSRTVVTVSGEIDMTVGPDFTTALCDAAANTQSGYVVVDLSQMSFMDSTGIRALN